MYRAMVKSRFSNWNQTNAESKMKEWQEQNPSDKYFFRKYNDICEEAPEKDSVEEDNDAEEIKLTSPLSCQKFLLVH